MATQMNAYVAGVEDVIGRHFTDPNKLWEALQAAGSPVLFIGTRRISDGHKRLALIGDSVLKLALISHWYVGTDPRGVIQPVVSSIGSNANLAAIGLQHHLDRFVVTSPASLGAVSAGTLASTVEAILGAAYLDAGMTAVVQIMRTLGLGPV